METPEEILKEGESGAVAVAVADEAGCGYSPLQRQLDS